MATFSENFSFNIDSSETVQLIHPSDSTTLEYTSEKLRGDGYYGRSDGFHTVQVHVTGFIGRVQVQGTLEPNPAEQDWFAVSLTNPNLTDYTYTVDTTGLIKKVDPTFEPFRAEDTYVSDEVSIVDSTMIVFGDSAQIPLAITRAKIYNFAGNYIWLRVKVSDWVAGAVNSIKLNH